MASYYEDPNVRRRIVEFLGGNSLDDATSVFVNLSDGASDPSIVPLPVASLWSYLTEEKELARSLWDHDSLLVDLDIEHVDFDSPGEAYRDPIRAFAVLNPVIALIQGLLRTHGIVPLHVMSGRGYHFVWSVRRDSPAFLRLSDLANTLDAVSPNPGVPHGLTEAIAPELRSAFAGLGMVLEYVGHQVLEKSARDSPIQAQLTAVESVPGLHAREIVSVDISEYGDPLAIRTVRVPFSKYLKPRHYLGDTGPDASSNDLWMIPIGSLSISDALRTMRDPRLVRKHAQTTSARIPDESQGMSSLIDDYQVSKLAAFHRQFYSVKHEPWQNWPTTYDRTPLDPLPACTRQLLTYPNDLLLKPAGIQHLVRTMLSLGWHPRHVAGLVRSKYERDFGWGNRWYQYDAALHADFFVRLFAGMIATGKDRLQDFDCRSTQAKHYCPQAACGVSLDQLRKIVIARNPDA